MNVENTIQEFWATRPRRPTEERKIGGVAAGIGRRYAIDPVLVRVAFVVATLFSGVGILLYLLGWLLLPADEDEVSPAESLLGRGRSSTSSVLTLVLCLALIPVGSMVFSASAYGMLGLALAGAAIILLHRSRAGLGELPAAGGSSPGPAPTPATGPAVQGTPDQESADRGRTDQVTTPGADDNRPTPPAWDPLSAAPFAWDLPEPTPIPPRAPAPPRTTRSKVTPITLGLALLVGGFASTFWPSLPLGHLVALVLGVVGLGLVVGSLVRGGRGLIVIAVPLALLTWVLHAIPVAGFKVGEDRWSPVTSAHVQPRYQLAVGSAVLDLSRLQIPEGQTMSTTLAVGIGEARVVLPPRVDADVVCRVPLGAVDCLGRPSSGLPSSARSQDNGADGPGGGALALEVSSGVGNVLVERAS